MITQNTSNINFKDSYIIGWNQKEEFIDIFMYLQLSEKHKQYEFYNEEVDFGCYKIAFVRFYTVKTIIGLDGKFKFPFWDKALEEYEDIYEINDFIINNEYIIILTDETTIKINCDSVEIVVLDSKKFNSNQY